MVEPRRFRGRLARPFWAPDREEVRRWVREWRKREKRERKEREKRERKEWEEWEREERERKQQEREERELQRQERERVEWERIQRRSQLIQTLLSPPEGRLLTLLSSFIFIMLAVLALELIGWFIFLGLLVTILAYLLLIILFVASQNFLIRKVRRGSLWSASPTTRVTPWHILRVEF
ncbi:hypothetical protein MSAN_00259300 [Mycena sanguinolenta]|uniref:Uncharacterized protein n=1 Tax=Mycena sanguinolenta TaxID=230812 RepID=A0A8H6ZG25_9AGAR|nr:hypothetical protein MSAN_00259300 [Mycena sanguinolenta]